MIVKNEEKVIQRCLFSCLPLIDYFVICDTGSTDKTIEMINEFSKKYNLPGEVHQHEWKNFEHNRNLSLEIAKKKGDYIFWIDADDILEYENNWKRQERFDNDVYVFNIRYTPVYYKRVHLVKSSIASKWVGVVHESLIVPQDIQVHLYNGITMVIVGGGGGRNLDPQKHQKDAALLEQALKDDPTNSRYMFYLAQSYRNFGDFEKAIEWYGKRAEIDYFPEERCYSFYQCGIIKLALNEKQGKFSVHEALMDLMKAHDIYPHRLEPLFYLVLTLNKQKMYMTAYNLACKFLSVKKPNERCMLFTEDEIWEFKLPYEVACSAANSGRVVEALILYLYLLFNGKCPDGVKEHIKNNVQICMGMIGMKELPLSPQIIPVLLNQIQENSIKELFYSFDKLGN